MDCALFSFHINCCQQYSLPSRGISNHTVNSPGSLPPFHCSFSFLSKTEKDALDFQIQNLEQRNDTHIICCSDTLAHVSAGHSQVTQAHTSSNKGNHQFLLPATTHCNRSHLQQQHIYHPSGCTFSWIRERERAINSKQ